MNHHSDEGMTGEPRRTPVATFLLLGATTGLALGLAEVAVLAVRRWGLGHYLHLNPQVAWLAPLFYGVAFAGLAAFVWLAGHRARDRALVRAIAFVTFAVGASGVFFSVRGLHRLAGLALAVGLAVHVSGLAVRHWVRLRARLHILAAGLALVVALAGALVNLPALSGDFGRRRAAADGAPNILWIIWDTVRAGSLSVYGYDRPTTPTLERLGRAGVVFEHAIATAPWTLPSHASMFTGLPSHEFDADWRTPLGRHPLTFAEAARASGYRTGGFVANLFYASRESGLARGFETYVDYPVATLPEFLRSTAFARTAFAARSSPAVRRLRRLLSRAPAAPVHAEVARHADAAPVAEMSPRPRRQGIIARLRDDGRKWAPQVSAEFLDWVSAEDERPFFAFLNYFDAHDPYHPPAPFDTAFGRDPRRGTPAMSDGKRYTPEEIEGLTVAYDASIAYLDHELDLLLRQMNALGLLDNTLIVVTADHGEEFGEHDVFTHGHSLYQPALRVPLIIAGPGVPAGVRVGEWVTIADVAATLQNLARLGAEIPGVPLQRHWETHAFAEAVPDTLTSRVSFSWDVPDFYPINDGPIEAVFTDPYKYIRNGDGREELYDLRKDPAEREDLATSADASAILSRLRLHVPTGESGVAAHR